MNISRQKTRQTFLNACDLDTATIKPLAQDASFRRYFRIYNSLESYILMDAPPEKENIQAFIIVAKHLSSLGLRAPEIRQYDLGNGFILLEDFGDNTFTYLLSAGDDETQLYELAVDTLVKLHKNPDATDINVADYSSKLLIDEALLLCDWYYPYQTNKPMTTADRDSYCHCWTSIFSALPKFETTLVLRDFHVDNLIKLENGQCGLLDFQDAVLGSAAYDLVSLLEDARRDVNTELQQHLLKRYLTHYQQLNEKDFMRWYAVLGAQRHCKVLGIFTRLSRRDNKHHYLAHLTRVETLLKSHLNNDDLAPLKSWLAQHNL